MLITDSLINGNVKLFHSFTNRIPNDQADFIDYEIRSNDVNPSFWTQFKSYFQRSTTTDAAKNGQVTFDDRAKVNCIESSASTIKLSIILMIVFGLFLL
jgi:hypothetical protein